jgi:hypothetical protein
MVPSAGSGVAVSDFARASIVATSAPLGFLQPSTLADGGRRHAGGTGPPPAPVPGPGSSSGAGSALLGGSGSGNSAGFFALFTALLLLVALDAFQIVRKGPDLLRPPALRFLLERPG